MAEVLYASFGRGRQRRTAAGTKSSEERQAQAWSGKPPERAGVSRALPLQSTRMQTKGAANKGMEERAPAATGDGVRKSVEMWVASGETIRDSKSLHRAAQSQER